MMQGKRETVNLWTTALCVLLAIATPAVMAQVKDSELDEALPAPPTAPAPPPAAAPLPPPPPPDLDTSALIPATTEPAAPAAPAPEPAAPAPGAQPAVEPAPQPATAPAAVSEIEAPAATAPVMTLPPSITNEAGPTTSAIAAAPMPKLEGNPALAERLAAMATSLLRADKIDQPIFQYCAALYEAAGRLAPEEPRYAMFLYDVANRMGDRETTGKALAAYRRLAPNDEFAQVQQIEAYLQDMPADRQLKYCEQLLSTPTIPSTVRSMVAYRAAMLCAERTENQKAGELISKAIDLNPLNLSALRALMSAQAPNDPVSRLQLLLQMLRCNPAQPAVGIGVARELSAAGLSQRAMEWFNQALDMHARMGITPPPDVGVDYAAQFLISGDAQGASVVCDRILEQTPNDINAWHMKLITAKALDNKEELAKSLKRSTVALTNVMAVLRGEAGDKTATTKPVDTPDAVALPDPNSELQRLAAAKRPELIQQFAPLAVQVAWQKIYFEETPQSAGQALAWIDALKPLVGENDPTLTRLHGWAFLAVGNKAGARSKFSTLMDTDPIAALGMIRAAEGDLQSQQDADALGRKTLARNQRGLVGALLTVELGKRGIKPGPGPDAAVVERVMNNYPKDWQRVIDQPQRFYALRLEPVRVAVQAGEPVLVRVTATNISNVDLTVGPDGVIHQDLWFDAFLRGVHQHAFPSEAYHRFAGPMVLKRNDSISQVVRLDQRALLAALESDPVAAFQITAMVMTNPTTVGGQVAMGPCGQRVAMSKLMERRAMPMDNATRARLAGEIQNGTPEQKVHAVEVIAKFVRLWARDQRNQQAAQQLVNWGADLIHTAQSDADPAVHAWASYLFSVMTADKKAWNDLQNEPLWLSRLMAVTATMYLDAPKDALAKIAQNDEDPTVKKLAAASLVANLHRATSQPTTEQTGATTAPAATKPAATPIALPETPAAPLTPAPAPTVPPTPEPVVTPAPAPAPTPAPAPAPAPSAPPPVSIAPAPAPAPAVAPLPPPSEPVAPPPSPAPRPTAPVAPAPSVTTPPPPAEPVAPAPSLPPPPPPAEPVPPAPVVTPPSAPAPSAPAPSAPAAIPPPPPAQPPAPPPVDKPPATSAPAIPAPIPIPPPPPEL